MSYTGRKRQTGMHSQKINDILLIILSALSCVCADLTQIDHDSLFSYLNQLSAAWVGPAKNGANTILSKDSYTEQDYHTFFVEYYSSHPITQPLIAYLNYPMFFWFSDNTHEKLQKAQLLPVWNCFKKILETPGFATKIGSDETFFDQAIAVSGHLGSILYHKNSLLGEALKLAYLDTLETLVSKHAFLSREKYHDPKIVPHLGHIRWQIHNMYLAGKPLTTARVEELITMLQLPQRYRTIFRTHSLWLYDNNKFSDNDLTMLHTFCVMLPKHLKIVRSLSSRNYYKGGNNPSIKSFLPGVNTFSTIGGYKENAFPPDWQAYKGDGFTTVVVHELAHNFDPVIYKDPLWTARRKEILTQAGQKDLNYLRSQVCAEYFQKNTQEFIASIANQWFLNSYHTLNLALDRFDRGHKEPINQVMFYCDILSNKGSTAWFYKNDESGMKFSRQDALLSRNANGSISDLVYQDTLYAFTLDSKGNVLAYEKTSNPVPIDTDSEPQHLIPGLSWGLTSTGLLCINLPEQGAFTISLYSLQGRKLYMEKVTGAKSLYSVAVRSLCSGLCILTIQKGKMRIVTDRVMLP